MYFTVNIFASLCYINDIFLMNLSIVPHGDLYLLQCLSFITPGLLIVQSLYPNFIVSISFCLPLNSVRWLPVFVGTAKVEKFFKLANFI